MSLSIDVIKFSLLSKDLLTVIVRRRLSNKAYLFSLHI